MKKIFIFSLCFLLLGALSFGDGTSRIRVVVDTANIVSKPEAGSKILAQATFGTILECTSKIGHWYSVSLPPVEQEVSVQGYIHQSDVEEIDKIAPAEPKEERKAERALERTPAQSQPAYSGPKPKLFSGSFLKFGWMTDPDPGGFKYAWLPSFGLDIGLSRNFAIGFELQPAYRSYSDIGLSVLPIMGFINLRGGINLFNFLHPFAGAGVGGEVSYSRFSFEGRSSSSFDTRFAYHFMFGTELNFKVFTFIIDYQITQVSDPAVDPNYWQHFILFGFRL